MISYPKMNRGGPGLVGMETPHIYRDPPKSITTRKYEPVNIADVMYMNRPDSELGDPSRINESIKMYARGKNPMVAIDYGAGQGAKNPYRVEVVRPPMYPPQTLQPISRPGIHQNISITAKPGMAPMSNAGSYDKYATGRSIHQDIANGVIRINPSISFFELLDVTPDVKTKDPLQGHLRQTMKYNVDIMRDTTTFGDNATKDINVYAVNAPININNQTHKTQMDMNVDKFTKDRLQGTQLTNIGIPMNPDSNHDIGVGQKALGQKEYFAMNSRITFNDLLTPGNAFKDSYIGDNFIHKDVLRPVNSAQITFSQLLNTSALQNSTVSQHALKDMQKIGVSANPTFSNIIVFDPKTNASLDVSANIHSRNYIGITAAMGKPIMLNTNDGKQIQLKEYSYSVVQPNIGNSQLIIQVNQPDIELERNTPLFAANTNITLGGDNDVTSRLTQTKVELERQQPLMTATAQVSLKGYNEEASHNDSRQLERQQALVSATAPVALYGYNEKAPREAQSQVKLDQRLSNFGAFEDRVSRPKAPRQVGQFQVGKKDRIN